MVFPLPPARDWADGAPLTFWDRLKGAVQDAIVWGVKVSVVIVIVVFVVSYLISDYAFVREQARYVAAVRQQQAQQAQTQQQKTTP